jgi:hypothetical protein
VFGASERAPAVVEPLPAVLTDQQAVHWLSVQPSGQVEATMTELADAWGWSRPTLRRRVDQGLIARRPGEGRKSVFSLVSAVDATVGGNAESTNSVDATAGMNINAATTSDTTTAPVSAAVPSKQAREAGQNTEGLSERPGSAIDVTTVAALCAALALAGVSGSFSIVGLTNIFAGSFWPIIGMGASLEAGKLSVVAWLGRHSLDAPRPLKAALAALVAFLMAVNAIGAYGYLAKAHIQHALAGDLRVAQQAAETDAKLVVQTKVVADLDRRVGQIDGAIETATQHGRSNTAMALADLQRKTRADLAAARVQESRILADLQVERAKVDGERRKIESELGPVRYISALIGAADETVMRWFILAVALILDPAAVVLLLAASRPDPLVVRRHRRVDSGLPKGPVS